MPTVLIANQNKKVVEKLIGKTPTYHKSTINTSWFMCRQKTLEKLWAKATEKGYNPFALLSVLN